MNLSKYYKILTLLLLIFNHTACVNDDFKTPEISVTTSTPDGQVLTLSTVSNLWKQEFTKAINNAGLSFGNPGDADAIEIIKSQTRVTFQNSGNETQFMEGYVISSDKAGNFFEELILQDKSSNPTAGIRILIDVNPLFTTYEFGSKVFIKLDGLSIGIENGVPTIGVLASNKIGQIPSFSQEEIIIRSGETAEITPLKITIEDFSDDLLNVYIKLNTIQFHRSHVVLDIPMTFAGEPTDAFDGERTIESCETGASVILSTSTFSDFKGLQLPTGQGSFEGILTKNFFGDTFNVTINDPLALIFNNPERCDPDVLECLDTIVGSTLVFEEDFTDTTIENLETAGWINKNNTGGELVYSLGSFIGNQYAQVSGFNSGETSFEVWLITPEIDLSTTTKEVLSFDVQANYANGNILTAFITTNYTGDITTTTWEQLDAIIPNGNPNGFGDFEPVGPVSISCIEGSAVRIGFRYLGGDPGTTTRYHIDNIKVLGD